MAATIQRQPFGELGTARLQSLVSAKNCQNAMTEMLAFPDKQKSNIKPTTPSMVNLPSKRAYEPTIFEDDSDPDTENVDPNLLNSKRSRCNDGKAVNTKPTTPHFILSTDSSTKSTFSLHPSSPSLKRKITPPPHDFPSSSLTSPAGRSPPSKHHKRINLLSSKHRNTSSPLYKSIHPPSKSTSSSFPFSLDEAIRGTLSASPSSTTTTTTTTSSSCSVEIKPSPSKPKSWFFDIYEDTPDEEAATLMEHSTLCLDLSCASDDEHHALARARLDRGKENIPPPGHVNASNVTSVAQGELSLGGVTTVSAIALSKAALLGSRRSIGADVMADIGEERAPLGEMNAEEFYAEGLDAKSVVIIAAESEEGSSAAAVAAVTAKGEQEQEEEETPVAFGGKSAGAEGPGFVIAEDAVEV